MLDQQLGQRAILEALEGKVGAFSANGGLTDGLTLEIFLWDDLAQKHQPIFKSASPEEIAAAIVAVEKESEGRYKLLSIKPSVADRDVLRVPYIQDNGRILDVQNLYWQVQYYEKKRVENTSSIQTLWLTPRALYAVISNKRRSFPLMSDSVPHRLLQWFSDHEGLTKSEDLATTLNTTRRTVATEIAKLRKKASSTFGLDDDQFIESHQGEGYGLGKGVKIRIEDEVS